MGLREKKKAKTKWLILQSVHDLLGAKDFNEISMEDIAESSGIAVGTLYNYFRSKGDLLLALILESDDDYLSEAHALGSEATHSPEERLTDVMVLASEYCVNRLSKSVWRHVSAASLTNASSDMGMLYLETTNRHRNLIVELVESLQRAGSIDGAIDARTAANSLFAMKSNMFLDFVSDESMPLEVHRAQVRQGVRLFLFGIATDPE